MPKPGYVVTGLVLFIDGIGLSAFCFGADLVGVGQGYGLGPMQTWGVSAGVLMSAAGLAILLWQAFHRPGDRTTEGSFEA